MKFKPLHIFTLLFVVLSSLAFCSNNDSTLFNTWQRTHFKKVVFIENAGQFKTSDGKAAPDLLFKVEAQGLNIYVTTKGLTYFFLKPKSKEQSPLSSNQIDKDSLEYEYHRFDIDLQNANIKKENIIKEGASSVDYNFIYPHCKQGIMSVKEYGKLTIQNVYPGIDWVLYGSNDKGLKYDFVVHASVNPQQISFLYKSLNPINLENDGNISLNTSFGNFMDSAPECFLQRSHSKIKSNYILKNKTKNNNHGNDFYETEIGFNIESYPKNETLIIDPLQLWWGTYYGGITMSEGTSVTTDSLGNLFVLGNTNTLDLPLQPYGSLAYFQGTYGGSNGGGFGDMFILKFTNAGQLLWATYFGGGNRDVGKKIKCDKTGDIFIIAETASVNFPLKNAGGGAYYDTTNGNSNWDSDLYLGKFSNSGAYLWGTYYGGTIKEHPQGIGIDIYNNVYFTGLTNSMNFPLFNPGGGALFQSNFIYTPVNASEAFVLKFSNSGQRLLSTFFGGGGQDEGMSIDCDHLGNVYFGGRTSSTNMFTLNPGGGAFFQSTLTTGGGNYSGFILKLNANCQAVWSTYISGITGGGGISSIICDNADNLFMTGDFGTGFPTVNPGGGAYFAATNPMSPMIITKFNPQSQMVWGTYYGSWRTLGNGNLALGACDEVYVVFATTGVCGGCPPMNVINPGNGSYCDSTYDSTLNLALPDYFIAAFTNSGIQKWGTYFGGAGGDETMNITCDKNGNLFYTGEQGLYYYYTPALLQTYTSGCIKDPGGGAYFQGTPGASLQFSSGYCVIGKFTKPFTSVNLSTSGCSNNDTIIAQPFSGWAPYNYSWSNGATTNSITNVPMGVYTCTITDGFLGCMQEQQIYFGVPTISVSAENDSICMKLSTHLIVQGADTYSWLPTGSLNSSSGSTVTASPNSTTNYTIIGTTSSNCSSTNTISLVVNPLPVITVSGIDSICKGTTTAINALGATNYSWMPSNGLNTTLGSTVIANLNQTQTYSIVGTDNLNCIDTTLFTLNIIPLPQLLISGSQSVCIGNSTILTASGANLFNWNFGTSASTNSTAIVSPTVNSTYTLSGTNSGICKDSISFTLSVLQLPLLSLSANDSVCQEEEFVMQAQGNGNISWFPSTGLSCTQCSNPNATLQSSTMYVATITDANLCTNKDSILIKVNESCGDDILIPNVFSPNTDGVNDFFKVKANNIKAFECEIYDRWGLKLFTTSDSNVSWNGIVPSGVIAPVGVYFYLIKITKFNNQVKDFKGHLTLVR